MYLGGNKEQNKEHVTIGLCYQGIRDGVEASYTIKVMRADKEEPIFSRTFGAAGGFSNLFATHDDEAKKWGQSWGPPKAVKTSALIDGWAAGVA